MSTAPLRMRSGLLTKSLRQRSRSGEAGLDAELVAPKIARTGPGICEELKREEASSTAEKEATNGPATAECMQEIKQILAQRESTRCLTFGCSPPSRSDNPLAATFSRCTPKPQPEACTGLRTADSCFSSPAHA